jgi:hypothetical protein
MHVGVQAHDSDAVGGIQIGYNWQARGYLVGHIDVAVGEVGGAARPTTTSSAT